MKRRIARRAMLGSVLIVAVAAPAAIAQMGYGPGRGTMMSRGPGGMGPGMMGGAPMGPGMDGRRWDVPGYLDALKRRLGITAAQEAAWKEYADTVSGVAEQMQGLHQTMFEAMGTATWHESQQMMNEMFQARQQARSTVHDAATKLLQDLSAEQKTAAEQVLPGLAFRRGMMR
ncbi:MAG: Spy/CpxP family protein refolding chaperone [Rhodospirillales bacterium]|nr:Spy/CpxP family protein refolding chaperone [Rhodospirillales bacterium]